MQFPKLITQRLEIKDIYEKQMHINEVLFVGVGAETFGADRNFRLLNLDPANSAATTEPAYIAVFEIATRDGGQILKTSIYLPDDRVTTHRLSYDND